MEKNLTAKASVDIEATAEQVWEGLINPEMIKEYMMGADVKSDWEKGSKITWKGEIKGKKYEDKGKILEIEPQKKLKYSHFSPLSGAEDKPDNYHTVTINVSGQNRHTTVTLSQDKNKTEQSKEESQKNWEMMLNGLKKVVEKNN
ncbi:MAG: SRPBCC domain-containing protein [Chitinophagaceae bacterium]